MDEKYVLGIVLDIHAYMGGKLCDYYFDSPPDYGIHGAEVMKPLADARGLRFDYRYMDDSTLASLSEKVEDVIGLDNLYYWVKSGFLYNDDYYGFSNDSETNLKYILDKYFGSTQEITVSISISCDAGEVYSERKLIYYMHSREEVKHNEPHVHVRDSGHNYEASLSIVTGKIFDGYLPNKLLRMAQNTILSKNELFVDAWNTKTYGLFFDINSRLEANKDKLNF